MASKYASVKLSGPFVEEARREADLFRRSVAAQVEHWAKLGRAFENTPGIGLDRVRAALDGRLKIEDLSAAERTAFLDRWGAHYDASQSIGDYFAELGRREGAVGDDEKGRLVKREASGLLARGTDGLTQRFKP